MSTMSRREFVGGTLAGAGLIVMAPVLPGCAASAGGRRTTVAPDTPVTPEGFAGLFGVDGELAGNVLGKALSRGGDFAEIYLEHTVRDSFKLEEGRVDTAAASVDMGAGIRVVVGDQIGYAYTESLAEEDLLNAATTAALIAHGGATEAARSFRGVATTPRYPGVREPTAFPVDEKMALLRRVDDAARAASSDIQVVVAFHNNEHNRILIYRSDGLVAADERPRTALGAFVSVRRGTRVEQNYYAEGGRRDPRFFAGSKPEDIAKEAVRRAVLSFEAVVPPAGEMPVVLAPGESGILLHEAVGHGLEADFNRKGLSIYADRVGEKVASELCTVVDDGTVGHSQGSLDVDDEGTTTARNVLIENGVLRSYMQDRISSRHYGVAPTGNGRRQSYRFPPVPRMTNTYLMNGPHSKEEVFEGIERGLYALAFTNGQVHIGAGDYTFFVNYGYLIENGRITAPVKDVNIVGNGPESLQLVDRVGNDAAMPDSGLGYCGKAGQRVPVNFGLPHLRIARVNVGGRA